MGYSSAASYWGLPSQHPSGKSHVWGVHLQQATGEEPFLAFFRLKLLGNYLLQGFFCVEGRREFQVESLRFARNYSGISIAKCCLLQAIEELQCGARFALNYWELQFARLGFASSYWGITMSKASFCHKSLSGMSVRKIFKAELIMYASGF